MVQVTPSHHQQKQQASVRSALCEQVFTDLSPTNKFATLGPLIVVLLLTMLKEGYEDIVNQIILVCVD